VRIAVKLVISFICIIFAVALGSSVWQSYHEGHRRFTEYIYDFARQESLWRLIIQIILVSLVIPLVIYFDLQAPIKKTTLWIKKVRRGEEPVSLKNLRKKNFLRPLIHEVAQVVKSLSMARLAAEEEARLRQLSESIWTPARLKEFIKTKLNGKSVFVVSNREPYRHVQKGKEVVCEVPASGLVTALEPILKACGGTWIAQGDGDADRLTVDGQDCLKVPPEEPQYKLRRVWVSEEEEKGYYYGFSNEGLWPLCHIAHTRPVFRNEDWLDYKAVNEKFSKALLEEIENVEDPCVLIQDYHFALLPALIKAKRPDARVAIFWHIPWPNPESFGICPWQKELLKGMLGADIIGFHTQYHCNNFLATVDRFLESRIDYERFRIHCEGRVSWIRPFPISIAFSEPSTSGTLAPIIDKENLLKPYGLSAKYIGVGVDRMDYTKGILERFRSVELFLEKNPMFQEKFTFVELAAPSRSLIPKYRDFSLEVQKEAERINSRFKGKNWKPILLLEKNHSHREILPFYQAADLCMVTSLHDGMNLVAKEFVMARADEKGVLILSQFTGAARELTDALIINPYDIVQTAQAIVDALKMPVDEQNERMQAMRHTLREHNIYRWAADLVGELAQVKLYNQQKANGLSDSYFDLKGQLV
jgi:trehalose 6-phosphate synthase